MPRERVNCPSCLREVAWSELRTLVTDRERLIVCRECFLEFDAENPGARQRKPKLVDQPSDGQLELPF